MSEEEAKDFRGKVLYGLALTEWKALKVQAEHNQKVATLLHGRPGEVSARYLYRKRYGNAKTFEEAAR